jgi:hypothetical protein
VFVHTGLYSDGASSLDEGWIVSVRGYHPHEIVHRVAGEVGNPGRFFHEGLAVALGDEGRVAGRKVDSIAREALRDVPFEHFLKGFAGRDPVEAYSAAGSFVRFLLRRFSEEALMRFFDACGRTGQPCPRAFERTFGRDLAAVVSEWREAIS